MTTPTPAPSQGPRSLPDDAAQATQDALGAEHAALWVYGLVSAFLPADYDNALREGSNAHRARRDATELLLNGAGQNPRSAEPAYVLPQEVTDEASALAVLVVVEADVTVAWRAVLERTDDRTLRAAGLAGLTDAAVRATRWRGAAGQTPRTPPLPGAPG
ncbi:ferritin-like domain-containing protein [Actinophytocola sp. NPDC049390]|uniref:ferritin-like domain-containing protein n=1 Tax=Actinophytocola sp. NPDC049390 TaxID=3363894 RepID=UPI0037B02F55